MSFIHDDFLLTTDHAQQLYHEYAANAPILDYHNHLPPAEIADNRQFANLGQIWLEGDHYKWRAMRANGEVEEVITGNADAKAVETYKTRELKNGRLAMIGIAGFVAADVIPGSVPSLA